MNGRTNERENCNLSLSLSQHHSFNTAPSLITARLCNVFSCIHTHTHTRVKLVRAAGCDEYTKIYILFRLSTITGSGRSWIAYFLRQVLCRGVGFCACSFVSATSSFILVCGRGPFPVGALGIVVDVIYAAVWHFLFFPAGRQRRLFVGGRRRRVGGRRRLLLLWHGSSHGRLLLRHGSGHDRLRSLGEDGSRDNRDLALEHASLRDALRDLDVVLVAVKDDFDRSSFWNAVGTLELDQLLVRCQLSFGRWLLDNNNFLLRVLVIVSGWSLRRLDDMACDRTDDGGTRHEGDRTRSARTEATKSVPTFSHTTTIISGS